MKKMKKPIGIDLGTTNCCVAYLEGATPRILKIDGRTTMPSVIAQQANGDFLIGKRAKECAEPPYRYGFIKRHMGLNVRYPFQQGPLTPTEISARFLAKLKGHAEEALGEVAAVITVPAHFTEERLKQTRKAANLAGLEVLDIVREPVAAAIAYHQEERIAHSEEETHILVYDLGGGTMDASLCIREGNHIRIGANGRAYDGDPFLGGLDFDKQLVRLIRPSLHEQGVDLTKPDGTDSGGDSESDGTGPGGTEADGAESRDSKSDSTEADGKVSPIVFADYMHELLSKAERVKMGLSEQDEAEWVQELQVGLVEVRVQEWIRRADYEKAIEPILSATLAICDRALLAQGRERPGADSRSDDEIISAEAGALDALILVGGSTRTPAVAEKLREHFDTRFGCRPRIERFREDECVAIGAAHVAARCLAQRTGPGQQGEFRLHWDVSPTTQVPERMESIHGPSGTIEGGLEPDWSLRIEVNEQVLEDGIEIGNDGRFLLPNLPLTSKENRFVLSLADPDGGVRSSWDWPVLRGGVSADIGGLARAIQVRLVQGEAVILPAGTKSDAAHTHTFYIKDQATTVRMPLYEGYHFIGTLDFPSNAPPGTPVKVRATYQPGAISITIEVGDAEEESKSLSLQPHDIQAERHQLEDRFHRLRTEIEDLFGKLVADPDRIDFLRKQWESLAFDLRSELEGQLVPDVAKIDDRLQRAETLRWHLSLLKNSIESQRQRCVHLRGLLEGSGITNKKLHADLQKIEQRLENKPHEDLLASIAEDLDELERSMLSRVTLVVTEQQVRDKLAEIEYRLNKIRQPTKVDNESLISLDSIATQARRIADDIESSPNQRLNRLWDLEVRFIRERYHEAIVARDRTGLLGKGS